MMQIPSLAARERQSYVVFLKIVVSVPPKSLLPKAGIDRSMRIVSIFMSPFLYFDIEPYRATPSRRCDCT